MSSTRKAADDSVYHQNRYASSFETGLVATMVARRCSVLNDKADRILIWWLHFLSWQDGGLKSVAETLVSRYGRLFGTEGMMQIGKPSGQNYTAQEVEQIRAGIPPQLRARFPLRGEVSLHGMSIPEVHLARECEKAGKGYLPAWRLADIEDRAAAGKAAAQKHPNFYSVDDFLSLCLKSATVKSTEQLQGESLDKFLRELCLNPDLPLHGKAPWFFINLTRALQSYMTDWIAERSAGVAVTSLGSIVHEMLDYTMHSRTMNLLEGDARTGKSFSARTWCEQHPGQARFIEVPTGNSDADFFRALARGLHIGNFSQYKAVQLRELVERVLLTGDILVCLDEAQRLWPQMNARYGVPKRINWLMSMVNQRVPFCLISTPQFLEQQNAWQCNAGWNSAQFIGRLGLNKRLPGDLTIEDLMAVASSILPEIESKTIRALAAYARTSARYLAAIDSIAARARYVSDRAGRAHVCTEDVRAAMLESVIPSDSALVRTLEQGKKSKNNRGMTPSPGPEPELAPEQAPVASPSRGIKPAAGIVPSAARRAAGMKELVKY